MKGKLILCHVLCTAIGCIAGGVAASGIGVFGGAVLAIVVAGGLAYATLMTLFIVPVMYDILYKKEVKVVDVGDDSMDDAPDDAAEFIEQMRGNN